METSLNVRDYPEPTNINDKEYEVTLNVSAVMKGHIHAKDESEALEIVNENRIDDLETDISSIEIHEISIDEV